MDPVYLQNRAAWDDRVRRGKSHTGTATEKDFANPRAVVDQCGWLEGSLAGKRVLCLAAGGGKQSVLFAALGAIVTVVDLSPEMLALDLQIAAERSLKVEVLEASMDDLSALADARFELVVQPVSTSYVPDVLAVYREVARVSAPGALYISQHKQPACLQADVVPVKTGYLVTEPYYRQGQVPPVVEGCRHREAGTVEFLHRWEDLLGGMCRSGFVIEDLLEPRLGNALASPGTFEHRSHYLPPFVTIKARRSRVLTRVPPVIWTPD
jgi:ubiquinone/menaquinone biosynthesis C-methylase UbiE